MTTSDIKQVRWRQPFAYDPLRHAAPDRWLKADKLRPGIRFFGLGNAYTELCNAREDARCSRNLPRWLERTRCSVQSYTALLDLIVAHWSLEPPRRQHRREPRNDEILVAHNFHSIRCLVRFSELAISDRSLALRLRRRPSVRQHHSVSWRGNARRFPRRARSPRRKRSAIYRRSRKCLATT
jgi:hypothetical protein